VRYVLPRCREGDIEGVGVAWPVLGHWSEEMPFWEFCNHAALGHGCSHTGLTCLPTYPGHCAFCALSVIGTLPATSKCPTVPW
jgi:hypothetical protein